MLNTLKMSLRFAWGIRSFARHPLSIQEAKNIVQRRLAQRDANFLRLVRRGIFEYAKSPFLPLMKLAGCEYADIECMLKSRGLEGTLTALRRAGVYVAFEELKGRAPIIRGGTSFPVATKDFENPFLKNHIMAETGGTTGSGRRLPLELDHLGEQSPQFMLTRLAHGCLEIPTAIWRGPIPDSTGLAYLLRSVRSGYPPRIWYTADLSGKAKPSLGYSLAEKCAVEALRFFGSAVPRPRPLPIAKAAVLAEWAAKVLKQQGMCCIFTQIGRALRICDAAHEAGIDLSGAVFMGGGESISPAKAKAIKRTGARFVPVYAMFELGQVGLGCANPQSSDDTHVTKDCFAVISHPHTLPQNGITVNALNFTTLLPTAPLLLLNAQIDDHAVLETRSCGCALHELGYDQHVSNIASYSKVVAEGVHFVGSDVVQILEEVLPQKFGGSPLDYQLVELEDQMGASRVALFVSPKVKLKDEEQVKSEFFNALKKGPASYKWARGLWEQSQVLEVRREEPYATARGKHLSLWRKSFMSDPDKSS